MRRGGERVGGPAAAVQFSSLQRPQLGCCNMYHPQFQPDKHLLRALTSVSKHAACTFCQASFANQRAGVACSLFPVFYIQVAQPGGRAKHRIRPDGGACQEPGKPGKPLVSSLHVGQGNRTGLQRSLPRPDDLANSSSAWLSWTHEADRDRIVSAAESSQERVIGP